jgi:integrase
MKAHSRITARKVLQGFRSIIKDAKRRGLIASNPAAETTIGVGKRHKRRLEVGRDIPTPAEIKSMIKAASGKDLALVYLALVGLRASELRGLRWTDLDLGSEPTVTIRQRADRWAQIGSPKSEAARRTVPLGEDGAHALRAWKVAQPPVTYREDGEKRQRPATLVFGTATDRPDTPSNLQQRLLHPLQVKAGVTSGVKFDAAGKPVLDKDGHPIPLAKYSWHALRHYAVSSWLRTCQGDFKLAQHWAGHATLALTLDTYGHLISRRDGYEMMRAIERDLSG